MASHQIVEEGWMDGGNPLLLSITARCKKSRMMMRFCVIGHGEWPFAHVSKMEHGGKSKQRYFVRIVCPYFLVVIVYQK